LPLLAEELLRAKVNIDLKSKKLVDAFQIFRKNEPRNLTAAYKFYCGKDLEDAHSAQADTMATYEVLLAQLERYPDVPDTVAALDEYTRGQVLFADFAGRIAYDNDGKEVFNFGKYKGQRVKDIFRRDPSYYAWLMGTDFPETTKQVFTKLYAS
jgi:DNA polymerase-3 subunit epsilon